MWVDRVGYTTYSVHLGTQAAGSTTSTHASKIDEAGKGVRT